MITRYLLLAASIAIGSGDAVLAEDTATPKPPGIVITRPQLPSDIAARPVPRVETPDEIATAKALREGEDKTLADRTAEVADTCDMPLKSRIDWTTIDPAELTGNSAANACGVALDAVEEACRSGQSRTLIQQQLKELICRASQSPAVSLRGGTMIYTLDWQSADPGVFVYNWLMTHL